MRVTVGTTAENCEAWLVELEVPEKTTVSSLKKILASPPHSLAVSASTKVLFRDNGVLTTLFDKEVVHSHVTLLNVADDKVLSFPETFLWGAATAAYQVEGAANRDGRTPSIWDTFCSVPGKIRNGDTGATACEHYHRFVEDVGLMKDLGLRAYRFSISWSRLLPFGRGKVNLRAVDFYTSLLLELKKSKITPVVTLYHWDLPQCLEDEYGGWLSRQVIADFEAFASICFETFGSYVKYWITLNEPWCCCALGYASGEHAPGRCSAPGKEPYAVAHNMLLAHARAVKCFRESFQKQQGGVIGPEKTWLRNFDRSPQDDGNSRSPEVMQALQQVKDEGLQTDIVSSGFVGAIKADRVTGNISLVLEVEVYKSEVEQRLSELPWAKSVEVSVGSVKAAPPSQPRPMPEIPKSLDKVKNIVAVSSCKGGVGKSTVAVNLAYALHNKGYKVGIFDCDVYGPSLPVMVRFQEETPKMEMYQDEQKEKHIRPVIHPETGMKLVSFGFVGHAAVMRGSMVTGVMSQLVNQTDWGELDYLILDMPPGTGDIHLTLSQVCQITCAVIVTTPQKLSVIDVERGISMFSQLKVPSVAVVQNMSYMSTDSGRQYIFGKTDAGYAIADTFGIEQVFELPLEASVAQAGDSGNPFGNQGDSESSKEMDKLADSVVQEVQKIHENRQPPRLFWDAQQKVLRLQLPEGKELGIDPVELRLRDKGAGGVTPPAPGVFPEEIVDMGNYAVVIKWSDGVVQVAPHKQLIEGDEKGPMQYVELSVA
ncbi:unnamed protein product [Effrenium voratum]|nr:unnamed protein product [Effrenium voratum]